MGLRIDDRGAENLVTGGAEMRLGELPIAIRGARNVVEVGPGLSVREPARLRIEGNGNRIVLGGGVSLQERSHIHVSGSNNTIAIGARCRGSMRIDVGASGARFEMGDGCTMVGARFTLHEPACMTLGEDCMLSATVAVMVSDVHYVVDTESGARANPPEDVRLGDHVWLGAQATVLKGVEIGTGSVIGAGAVVTRSIPANCVAAGVPARVIRRQVAWHRRAFEFIARAADAVDLGPRPSS